MKPYKKLSQKTLFENKYIKFNEDEFEGGNGIKGEYYYLSRDIGVVHGLGVDPQRENFIITKQYRYPLKKFVFDVPGGAIDEGETPEEGAIRELYEETGYKGKEIVHLGKTCVEPSKADYWLHEYLILDVKKVGEIHGGEPAEATEVIELPIKEAWQWIKESKIDSCHSISTITKALIYLDVTF